MPRQTIDQAITTRAARERLVARREPYWRSIETGISLGYRRGSGGGTWIARTLVEGSYRETAIGRADDNIQADGVTYLEFRQAAAKVRAEAAYQHHAAAGLDSKRGSRAPYTVADATEDYLRRYEREGGKDTRGMRNTANAHILPHLGAVRLDRLTRRRLTDWRDDLAAAAPRVRTRAGVQLGPKRRILDPADTDAIRRRRASTNRVLTCLKAALNFAYQEGHIQSKMAWELVKPFRQVNAPRIRYLSGDEIVRLVNACDPDLRQIVIAGVLTGMRYGEITRLRAHDFDREHRTIYVELAKSGHPRHVHLTDEGCAFFEQAITGRLGTDFIFTHPDGSLWGKSHQFRPLREACVAARIEPAISFHILRHTYASRLASAGTSMNVIALQLGHRDTRITERHYAHLAPSYVADVVRSSFGTLGILPTSNVTPMSSRREKGSATNGYG